MYSTSVKISLVVLITLIILFILLSIYVTNRVTKKDKNEDYKPHKNKKIFILYTGGPLGMLKGPDGYLPREGLLETKLDQKRRKVDYVVHEYQPLLDSSSISPKDWLRIAQDLNQVYDMYDAFIIVQGTDTLAYTASALAFMLETLNKTVVVTGKTMQSLITSVDIASSYTVPEVLVVIDEFVLRGSRSKHTQKGFVSPHYPDLGTGRKIDQKLLMKPPKEQRVVLRSINPKVKVVVVKLFPGVTPKFLMKSCEGAQGVVLEVFGGENNVLSPKLMKALESLVKKGVTVVDVSQGAGNNGRDLLQEVGVVSGKDMTTEAALTKLCFLLSNVKDRKVVMQLVGKNMRGEVTE